MHSADSLYIKENKKYIIHTYKVYQNVFCYHCNQPSEDVSTDAVCSNHWFRGGRDGGTFTGFTFLLDTALNIAAFDSQRTIGNRICAVNEVYDQRTVSQQPTVDLFVSDHFISFINTENRHLSIRITLKLNYCSFHATQS